MTLQQQLNQAKLGKKGNAMKWVTASVVVVVLAWRVTSATGTLLEWQAKRSRGRQGSQRPATGHQCRPG